MPPCEKDAGGDLDDLGPVPPGRGHRAVARARVADEQLDLGVDLLGARGCEHLIEQRASVAHRDRDGHDVGHGYERRRRPRIESRNDEKKTCSPTMIRVAASDRQALLGQGAEVAVDPDAER